MKVIFVAAAAALLLAGCASTPALKAVAPAATSSATASSAPAATPTPTPTDTPEEGTSFDTALAVSPDLYTAKPWASDKTYTPVGLDFENPDHKIHCAIYGDTSAPKDVTTSCLADDGYLTYTLPILPGSGEMKTPSQGVQMVGTKKSILMAWFDVEFAGQDPANKVNVLAEGTSITWGDVTCATIDGGIQCQNGSTSNALALSKDDYYVGSTK